MKGKEEVIRNRKELKRYIKADSSYYNSYSLKNRIRFLITNDHLYQIKKYMKLLRTEEYYKSKNNILGKILESYYARKKNILGNKLGFYIRPFSLGEGATIYHHGTIIIHGNARIGKNCKLHGDNCIGNNGIDNEVPIIGDNVDIGFGAKLIGNIKIPNDVKIGAGAIVINSFYNDGATLVGIPAREVNN